ncbi:MAG: DUF853 family protein [Thermoguttaceae bacterium]|nr:DUF853 family protein [Thermoguttaceae bacterium]
MLTADGKFWIAQSEEGPLYITPKMANRHGLIAGATGTGKTVSLQVLAETFSRAGVPCFMSDMKGDLSGISQPGRMTDFIAKRCQQFQIDSPLFAPCPTRFFDVFGKQGHPLRTTISSMGPLLLARLLELNETQTGVLNIVFRIADEKQLLLIDMKDLRLMLDYVSKHRQEYTSYGNIAVQTIGAIQRGLLTLENQGGDLFFGEPDFDVLDFIAQEGGYGVMNILAADELMQKPKLYSTFLLWLLTSLYAKLPEVGDPDKPKLVFFFDEAHTLFEGTSKTLIDQIEQVVRLIRSKGVGVYFVTQLPTDISPTVLGQLGNRVQHALHAFTPKDQRAVKTAADTFRPNPAFSTAEVIQSLGTGEALVSFLDESGTPGIVQKASILFPLSQIGAITPEQRAAALNASPLRGKYDNVFDRHSAYEVLTAQNEEERRAEAEAAEQRAREKASRGTRQSVADKVIGTTIGTIGREIGGAIGKKALGNKIGGSVGRNIGGSIGRNVGGSILRGLLGVFTRR